MFYNDTSEENVDFNVLNFAPRHGKGRPLADGTIQILQLYSKLEKCNKKSKKDMLDLLPFNFCQKYSRLIGLQTAEIFYENDQEED